MSDKRRKWDGEQILAILKRHLVDKVELSKICEEEDIQPSQFYRWQAQLFAEGAGVFQRKNSHGERREHLDALERKSGTGRRTNRTKKCHATIGCRKWSRKRS